MPRRAFFRTLSGTFSSKQQQQDSNNDAQALQRRPPTIEEGGGGGAGEAGRAAPESVAYRRRTSHTLRPKERKQTGLTAAALERNGLVYPDEDALRRFNSVASVPRPPRKGFVGADGVDQGNGDGAKKARPKSLVLMRSNSFSVNWGGGKGNGGGVAGNGKAGVDPDKKKNGGGGRGAGGGVMTPGKSRGAPDSIAPAPVGNNGVTPLTGTP
ncbi:unnamed protein product, partial [Pylaiella littoralis]